MSMFRSSASQAKKNFEELDQYFVKEYTEDSGKYGKTLSPIIVVNDVEYELLTADGKVVDSFSGIISPNDELKAVGHITSGLFSIGMSNWREIESDWKEKFIGYQKAIRKALRSVDQVDWSNPAWPGEEKKLENFMRHSLQLADDFISKILQKGSYTKEDYEEFAEIHMKTMVATMYLSQLGDTWVILQNLKKWKETLGAKWDDLYVLIIGTKGRAAGNLSIKTNPAAQIIASLMNPDLAEERILIMPRTDTNKHALIALGAMLNAKNLASLTFVSNASKKISGLYEALRDPRVPPPLPDVEQVLEAIENGTLRHPLTGLGLGLDEEGSPLKE